MDRDSLISEYTADSHQLVNEYLFIRNQFNGSKIDDFKILKALDLNRIILLDPSSHPMNTLSVSNNDSMSYYIGINDHNRKTVPSGSKILDMAFTSSTDLSSSELYHLSKFFSRETCCLKNIHNDTVPFYKIPRELSYFPDQSEVLIPFDIIMEYSNKTMTKSCLSPHGTNERYDKKTQKKFTDRKDCQDHDVPTYNYTVLSQVLDRTIVDYINSVLKRHYVCNSRSEHDWKHICSVILLGCILYGGMCDIDNESPQIDEYNIIILCCLYHDVARHCKDGPDLWEKESAELAKEELSHTPFKKYVDDIYLILSIGGCFPPESIDRLEPRLKRMYLSYKGADSIDIIRVGNYYHTSNPLHSVPNTPYSSLYNDGVVEKHNDIHRIVTSSKDDLERIDHPREESIEITFNVDSFASMQCGPNTCVYGNVRIDTLNRLTSLLNGITRQYLSEDPLDSENEVNTILDNEFEYEKEYPFAEFRFVSASETDFVSEITRKICFSFANGLFDHVNSLQNMLIALKDNVNTRFQESSRKDYLFDYYCTMFFSLIHYNPVYHRYMSYLKIPHVTRV